MSNTAFHVFLMAPTLSDQIIDEGIKWCADQGFSLVGKEQLTSELVKGECVRLTVESLHSDRIPSEAILEKATSLQIDIVVLPISDAEQSRRLVCFDMDSTLIQAEVIDELARACNVYDEVADITARSMRGEFDFQQSFRLRMSKLKGLPESTLAAIAEKLPLMPGVEVLLKTLNECGYRTAIISGGFTYFAEYLQQRLGFSEVHANTLNIADGAITGEVEPPILDAERKAFLLKEIAEREGYALEECVAVGDGANDLRMLSTAGLGVAFHAKPLVREQAKCAISTLGLDALLFLLP